MASDNTTTAASGAAFQPEALRCAEWLEHIAQGGNVVSIEGLARTAAAELRNLHALTTAAPAAPAVASGAASLGPMNDRAIVDAIRSAYDLGYRDGAHGGASAAHQVERDHGGALIHTLSRAPAAPAAQEAEPATSAPVEGTAAGWKSHAEAMERERDYYRQRVRTLDEHQEGQVWYWQNDGGDHLESMVNSLPVVIRADQLRALLAVAARPQADVGAPETPEGCTPADARMLRQANHDLAAESFELQQALRGIVAQAGGALARFDIAPQADAGAVPTWTSEMIDKMNKLAAELPDFGAAPQAPAAPVTPNCPRCLGSGEDPEGYYDQSKGDAGHTHDGPCRDCSGTGEAPAAPTPDRAAFQADWERRHYPVPMNTRMRDDGRYGDAHVEAEWVAFQGTTPAPAAPTAAACAYAPLPKPYSAAAALGLDDLYTGDDMRAYADAHRAAPAPAVGATDPQLLTFYGAASDAELIAAQAAHIERLQAKLPLPPSFAPQQVRGG